MSNELWHPISVIPTPHQRSRHGCRFLVACGGVVMEARYAFGGWCTIAGRSALEPEAWSELPEPPPKSDAFEEFWAKWAIWQNGEEALRFQNSVIHKNGARLIWDAAIASTKGNHEHCGIYGGSSDLGNDLACHDHWRNRFNCFFL